MSTAPPSAKKPAPKRPRWIKQIARDADLPSRSVRFGVGLASFVNEKTALAWPSQTVLAQACGMSLRHLQRSCRPLVERGHLIVKSGSGRRTTSVYRIVLADEAPAEKDDNAVDLSHGKGRHNEQERSTEPVAKGRRGWRTNLIEPNQEPSAAGAPATDTFAPAAQGHWWDAHPAWADVAARLDRLTRLHLGMCTLEADDVLATAWPRVLRGIKAHQQEIEAILGHPISVRGVDAPPPGPGPASANCPK